MLGDAKADQQILGALGTLRARSVGVVAACLLEGGTTYQQRRAVADPVALAQGGHGVALDQRLGTERHHPVAAGRCWRTSNRPGRPPVRPALQRVELELDLGRRPQIVGVDEGENRPPRSPPRRRCAPPPRRHSCCRTSRTRRSWRIFSSTMATEPSVDPSSTTTISSLAMGLPADAVEGGRDGALGVEHRHDDTDHVFFLLAHNEPTYPRRRAKESAQPGGLASSHQLSSVERQARASWRRRPPSPCRCSAAPAGSWHGDIRRLPGSCSRPSTWPSSWRTDGGERRRRSVCAAKDHHHAAAMRHRLHQRHRPGDAIRRAVRPASRQIAPGFRSGAPASARRHGVRWYAVSASEDR